MTKINVVLSYLIGGAYVGTQRIAKALPQYSWTFTQSPQADADIVIYMNDNKHYVAAKKLGIQHIIQRKTGVRSLKVPEPDDLDAVICASKVSFDNSKHPNRVLIYNGLDFNYLNSIVPKPGIDLLVAESRIGTGQVVEKSIQYAIKHKRHLTILGSGKGLAENTYDKLMKKYPQCTWVGRVKPEVALSYIKGAKGIIISNPSHGVANQALEALAMDVPVILLAPLEIPSKADIDLTNTAAKYAELFDKILSQQK